MGSVPVCDGEKMYSPSGKLIDKYLRLNNQNVTYNIERDAVQRSSSMCRLLGQALWVQIPPPPVNNHMTRTSCLTYLHLSFII